MSVQNHAKIQHAVRCSPLKCEFSISRSITLRAGQSITQRRSNPNLQGEIMLHFIQNLSLSAALVATPLVCCQTAMACGKGCCNQGAAYCVPMAAAPAPVVAPVPVDPHAGHVQTGGRVRYQSGYQAPVMQPQYAPRYEYRPRSHSWDDLNKLPKADPRRFSRGF